MDTVSPMPTLWSMLRNLQLFEWSNRDSYPVQYLGYCTGCNSYNISHGLNPMLKILTRYLSKLAIRVPIYFVFSFQFTQMISEKLSLLSYFSLTLSLPPGVFLSLPPSPWRSSQPQLYLQHSHCSASPVLTRAGLVCWITLKRTNLFPHYRPHYSLKPTLCSEIF